MSKSPHVIVLAGPNGAGKSTSAPFLLAGALRVTEFVNADAIAAGLSGFSPETAALAAGQIMLERLHELAARRASFAFETTLASRTYAPWIRELRDAGYRFELCFMWLPSPGMAIQRVQQRVRTGGHNVDRSTVIRRYAGGLKNFFLLYRPIADYWRVYDSSRDAVPSLIAEGRLAGQTRINEPAIWEAITREYDHA